MYEVGDRAEFMYNGKRRTGVVEKVQNGTVTMKLDEGSDDDGKSHKSFREANIYPMGWMMADTTLYR